MNSRSPNPSLSHMARIGSQGRLHIFLPVFTLFLTSLCQAVEKDVTSYLDRYRQSTANCGDTELCCIRRARCLTNLHDIIETDYAKQNRSGIFAIQEYSQVVLAAMDEMTSEQCPTNIQLAFHRFKLVNPSYESFLQNFLGMEIDVAVELLQSIDDAIATHPGITDEFMDCANPVMDSGDSPAPSEAQREYLTIKKAMESKDYQSARFYAELYINKHGNAGNASPELAEVNNYLAVAYFTLKRPDQSLTYFEIAATLFEQLGDIDSTVSMLEKLVVLYSEYLDDLDTATDKAIKLADIHLSLKNGAKVSRFANRAAVFRIRQGRIEDAQTLLKRYTSLLEAIDADLNAANLRLFLADTYLKKNDTTLACEQFETIDALLQDKQVEHPKRYTVIRSKVDCSNISNFSGK